MILCITFKMHKIIFFTENLKQEGHSDPEYLTSLYYVPYKLMWPLGRLIFGPRGII